MANTVIAIKKSATPAAQPTVLANGELAINYADGKLFYKHANGTILPFNTQGGNAFGTINANGTLVVAGTSEAVVSLIAGNNITITGDAINDTITINATSDSNVAKGAFDKANAANYYTYLVDSNTTAAFTKANAAPKISISDTAPSSGNANGDQWWSSTLGKMFIYYVDNDSSQWVESTSNMLNIQVGVVGYGIPYDMANTANLNAKTANDRANAAYLIANTAYDKANAANIIASLGYDKANTSNVVAVAAFAKANSALANSSTVFAGNLTITGNLTVSSNTVSVNGQNVSPVQSFRNKIINGNFDHWQRGTSNTSIAAGQYLADRWASFRVGTTANISRQSFTLGQTDVPNEPTYFHRIVTTSSAGAGNFFFLYQPIESARTLAGQTATLSFWAKADASKNIAVEFPQNFGTGGSPSSAVNTIGATCALTTSWQKFTVTVNIPSISGKTLGSNNDDFLGLYFWLDAGSDYNSRTNSLGQQSGTFDIAQVQLEAGSVATPFEMRPIGTELALCQRYYQGNAADGSEGNYGNMIIRGNNSSATGNFYYWMPFSVVMRGIPTMSVGNPIYSNASSAAFFNIERHGAEISLSVASGGGYAFIPWSASAEL